MLLLRIPTQDLISQLDLRPESVSRPDLRTSAATLYLATGPRPQCPVVSIRRACKHAVWRKETQKETIPISLAYPTRYFGLFNCDQASHQVKNNGLPNEKFGRRVLAEAIPLCCLKPSFQAKNIGYQDIRTVKRVAGLARPCATSSLRNKIP